MPFNLIVPDSVFKELEKTDGTQRKRIRNEVLKLADNPFPEGKKWKRLKGVDRSFVRLRVGDYRVMYDVVSNAVHILGIVHRKDLEKWIRQHR